MRVTPEQKKQLHKIGREHALHFIILHGSYAKGIPRRGSDLDIAYVGGKRHDLDAYLKIFTALENVFGNTPQRELDVKELCHADPLFRYHVVRDGVLLFGHSTAYADFKAYAYRDYMDSVDLRKLQDILLEKSIKELSQKYAG